MRQKNAADGEHRPEAERVEIPADQTDRSPEEQQGSSDDDGWNRNRQVDQDAERPLRREAIVCENIGGEGP